MFSPALARRSAGSGRGGPVPFRLLWPVVLEDLSRAALRAGGGRAETGDARAPAAPTACRDVAATPFTEGVAP